ncbi:hypothetical protein ACFXPW_09930 [Streptomyces goshikiensis]|uniref:hypothetical protein n=1 Tax=Streptomyces goshikiensis TaxID=1942 RepID=UPI00369725D1
MTASALAGQIEVRIADRGPGIAAAACTPDDDASTTIPSDADTAVPELVAAAVGRGHTLQVEGKVFRGVVREAGATSPWSASARSARASWHSCAPPTTRDDGENLDIVMATRESNPRVRAVMRLYGDDLAATVSRTMRAGYPEALTRSRSVSALSAPSLAAAMTGRHVLGVMEGNPSR